MTKPEPQFHKSSYCGGGACVEVAQVPDGVLLRDGKDRDGPVLPIDPGAWADFVSGVKAGEFDA